MDVKDNEGNVTGNCLKESLGCEDPLDTPREWIDENEKWYNCPVRFICRSASDFLDEYNAYKRQIATPPIYGEHSAKFLEALWLFESFINKFIEEKKGRAE